ncbi:AraC family transcriptional regulator [Pontiella agarivorans]|uniref:DNA-binding transcriptional regulator n=1 Tax=Pontiella agarivorans TaxID=3038953 RepID=A0ABU5N1Z2_9BACT|nr:DNA-binding transcriptional regulator [Pontiella agarivorans]MDZ8120465.1 DNA-binding transcriptional regulator [Pontiella agarivorans]
MAHNSNIPNIAILVDTATGWGRRVVRGILSYVHEHGPWHVWVKAADRESIHDLPPGWKGDGVIARISNPGIASKLKDSSLPVVNVSGVQIHDFLSPRVTTDTKAGARMAMQHFMDRGFKNFAYAGPVVQPVVERHLCAFERVLTDEGFPCRTCPISLEDETRASDEIQRELWSWLVSLPKPVGILTWGAAIGRNIIDACLHENISVPHDVAVLGGDFDELLCEACYPALSGIVTPAEQTGYKAAQLLHEMMQGKTVSMQPIYIPPSGVESRLSTDTVAVADPRLVEVMDFMRKHAYEEISVADVLKAVPMGRRVLERKFKLVFGRTPLEEIRRMRIDKARKLLAETDLSMQEIAEACGYATYNYLTQIFKRVTGVSPSVYRKQQRGWRDV